ncbi:RFWD2 [Lepeophtheirus salmonis]|uniref:Cytosol aminopeptidase n=1 Tax=Lepeophtheirus salmonis TaxID=72036 RepID=A0A7R8CWA2_LEPSM|nr:RFWD2 [Lepeophtheirus salmonis]CAF2950520.1 RFWD2 [Lepeophtheirus salmonis]
MALLAQGLLRGFKTRFGLRGIHTVREIKKGVVLGVYRSSSTEFSLTSEGETHIPADVASRQRRHSEDDFSCPVCFDILKEPHMTRCGHSFCYSCLNKSLKIKPRCPKCSFDLHPDKDIYPNFTLNQIISKLQKDNDTPQIPTSNLSMSDINRLLGTLHRRKKELEKESFLTQNELLAEFLSHLKVEKDAELLRIRRESEVIQADLDHVNQVLQDYRTNSSNFASGDENNVVPSLEVSNPTINIKEPPTESSFPMRRRRMHKHVLDLSSAYYSSRAKEMSFTPEECSSSLDYSGLKDFSLCLNKFTKYNTVKPLATLSYMTDMFNNTSIVSSIDFDKDNEFFCYWRSQGLLRGFKTRFGLRGIHTVREIKKGVVLGVYRSSSTEFSLTSEGETHIPADVASRQTIRRESEVIQADLDHVNQVLQDYRTNSSNFASGDENNVVPSLEVSNPTINIKEPPTESSFPMLVLNDLVDIHYPSMEMVSSSKISCISWSSFHKGTLVSSDYEGSVVVWDANSNSKIRTFQEHEKRCWSVDFNRIDTKLVASGSDDARVKLWSTNIHHSVASLEAKANVCCVKFNPESCYHLAFWVCRSLCHKKAVSYVKFLNSESIVSASTDSQLKLWNVNRSDCMRSFTGHTNEKNFVGLATDGEYITCGSENNDLHVYYKGLPKSLFSFKFDSVKTFLDRNNREDNANEFVSAVCWRQGTNVVLCANSQGVIKVLELTSGPVLKAGSCRVVLHGDTRVALVGLGEVDPTAKNGAENRDLQKEAIRTAVASGVQTLKSSYTDLQEILVDPCGDPEASAEGSFLCQWKYDELKQKKHQEECQAHVSCISERLWRLPANHLTPTLYAEKVVKAFSAFKNVNIQVHDQSWAAKMGMGSFLSVSAGSAEPPKFLEMTYQQNDTPPVILVGKGVTFDTGGISIKPSKGMDLMRADMGGAAVVTGALLSAQGHQTGDVVKAMNGKTIQVDNTDAEGRLILADALCYADTFKPSMVIDAATLTGAMAIALGGGAAGTFTNSDALWDQLQKAGEYTGDRLWRLPLWDIYSSQVKKSVLADLNNIGSVAYGGSCTAAAFLQAFTECKNWAHLDIAGVMDSSDQMAYLGKGMTGRPTRTLVEFLRNL